MRQFEALLENVCDEIVSFEMGVPKRNDHKYFETILKITSWTEIRSRWRFRLGWSLDKILWRQCLQPCLVFINEKVCKCGNHYECCWYQSEGECECFWAGIEFYCMGNIKLNMISLLRYVHIAFLILIVFFYIEEDYLMKNYLLYGYIALICIELLVANCSHYFSTRFKLLTVKFSLC